MLSEDYAKALEMMREAPVLPDVRGFRSGMLQGKAYCEFRLYGRDRALPALQEARRALEADLDESPDAHDIRGLLAECLALLGEDAAAMREARLAVDETAMDRFFGPENLEQLAVVYAIVGQHDAAIDILEQLLTTTYVGHMTRHNLRIGPWWDPLREHVRFKALLQEQT
jgi:tetratricopeptide (TPR) repeat protein